MHGTEAPFHPPVAHRLSGTTATGQRVADRDVQTGLLAASLKAERKPEAGAGGRAQRVLESKGLNFVLAVDKMLPRLHESVVKIQI